MSGETTTLGSLRTTLDALAARGVELWLHRGQVRYRPPGALSQEEAAALGRHSAELVTLLEQAARGPQAPAHPPVPTGDLAAEPRPEVLPLSHGQESLWFLDQLGVHGPSYNVTTTIRIEGALDTAVLHRALDEIVRRHEVLRTRFPTVDGAGTQVVVPDQVAPFTLVDLADLAPAARRVRADEVVGAPGGRRFDLATECALDIHVVRLTATEHLLVLNVHHILFDGSSLGIVLGELKAIYDAFRAGRPSPLPELRAQYADYATWQRRWLDGDAASRQLAYWRERLAGAPESLDLPFDHVRPAVPDHAGGTVERHVGPETTAALAALAGRHGTTTFTVMLAAFVALLSRWSGQRDVSVGVPVDSRAHPDAEALIGYFLNTVVLRVELDDRTPFTELLDLVRGRTLEAYQHRHVPFDLLVADLAPQRELSRQPLFQVMFSHLVQGDPPAPDGLRLSFADAAGDATAKFDLSLFVAEGPDRLTVNVEYATSLFDRASIERLAGLLLTLLDGVVTDPATPVADLPLLTEAERDRLRRWNAGASPWRDDACLHQLFEEQVRRTPAADAVVHGGDAVSFDELNRRANRWAVHLRGLGVGPETRVGICLDRTLDVPVALLAVLKAGGAYVPLDAAYPRARLSYMLGDSGAPVVLTQAHLVDRLGDHGAAVVRMDADAGLVAGLPDADLPCLSRPANLAYCLYTSGSTGRPKGVALEHRNAVSFVAWAHQELSRDDLARVLFSTSISFDLSVFELFATLLAGGTAVLVANALALCEPWDVEPPTLVNTVPSAGQAIAEVAEVPATVRVISLAGEPLRRTVVDGLQRAAPQARIYNCYGPSETTTFSTGGVVAESGRVTVGRPVANTRLHVLDERLAPVPVGVRGEIHIAGPGVTRGYLHQPRLTAERYLPDPFGPPGSRMYTTNDLGRYRDDGTVEFMGRSDFQVKVRGYRIELGEIESALLACEDVADAAVVARDAGPGGDRRLVGYVVPDVPDAPRGGDPAPAAVLDAERLQAALRTTLPDYMVPPTLVFLDELPLTPSGKLDRGALPAPVAADAGPGRGADRPATAEEEMLAGLFAEVLGLDGVGADDDFFVLGGHSLLAVRLVNRVHATMGRQLNVRDVFERPTPTALAGLLGVEHDGRVRPPLVVRERPRDIPLAPAQPGLWYLQWLKGYRSAYNVPFALRLSGPLDTAALDAALRDLLDRHEVLRTLLPARDGRPVQQVVPIADIASVLRVAPVDADDLAPAIAAAVTRELDLERELPLHATLLRRGPTEHVLVLVVHHLAIDGWSFDLLWRDLAAAYAARTAGHAPGWEPLPVQYADYALWQRELLGTAGVPTELARDQLDWWVRRLADLPTELDLPLDRPRPTDGGLTEGRVTRHCDARVHAGIQRLCRQTGATGFMVVQAAVAALLHRAGAGPDVVLGTPMTGRTDEALTDMIGYVINTLVLRTDTSGDPTFRELVERVRRDDVEAFARQDLPFDRLVEELNPVRSPNRNPLFQVFVTYVGDPAVTAASVFPGVAVSEETGVDRPPGAKADLLFDVTEHRRAGEAAGIECELSYGRELFDPVTAERLVAGLVHLLDAVATDPTVRLGDVELPDVDALAARPRPEPEARPGAPRAPALRPAAPGGPGGAGPLRPRTPREAALVPLFAEVLAVDPDTVGVDDDFFALGGHSLLAVQLLSRIRDRLGVELGLQELLEGRSVAAVAAALDAGATGDAADPYGVVLPLRPGPGTPLFCVHPIIGLGWSYTGLARYLPDTTPLVALQARGLDGAGDREPPPAPASVGDIADDLVGEVRALQPTGPYRLLGWSFGGNVAHAMATRLQGQGERVDLLALVDSYHFAGPAPAPAAAPAPPSRAAPASEPGAEAETDAAASVVEFVRRHLGDGAFDSLDERRLARVAAVTARNVRLLEADRPGRFRGDVLFFHARREPDRDPALTPAIWRHHVEGRLEVHGLDSGHFALLDPGPVASIAAVVAARLRDVEPAPRPIPRPSPEPEAVTR